MVRNFRANARPARRLAIALFGAAAVIAIVACTEVVTREPPPQSATELRNVNIVGVTTTDGRGIEFDTGTDVDIEEPAAPEDPIVVRATVNGMPYEIELEDIQRIWVARQELSEGGRIALITVGVVALIALLADDEDEPETTNTSCPFIYSWNGSEFVMDAEPYGGATSRGLERDDFSELENLVEEDGYYRLLVRNELQETQYADLMELVVVDHAAAQRVIVDEHGQLHAISDPLPPIAARDHLGNDLKPWLEAKDHRIWEALPVEDGEGNIRTEIVLSFPKPEGATDAKLVATAATGMWGASMVKEMLEIYGRELPTRYTLVDSDPEIADRVREWNIREELYALQVHIQEPTGWEPAGILPGGGPYAVEDRVVPLDVSRVAGDVVRIRIRPPVGFWALDWLAMDYSGNPEISVRTAPIETALDQRGRDVRTLLTAADGLYHEMPRVGDEFLARAAAPARVPGLERTVFLHSRGYYRLHLDARGRPDLTLLQEMELVPDRAARFAVQKFNESLERFAIVSEMRLP
ncbi:MAG TPA: hypothetical protein VIV14_03000 [Gammaproteobacteria bacterium]